MHVNKKCFKLNLNGWEELYFFFIAIQRTLLTKQDKNTTNNTTNNTTKIRYVNYLLHSTSLQYTTFTFFLNFYYTPIYLASYNPGEVST